MKGTRLYQRAHSPLIEGRSRRERPFARDWGIAALVAVSVGLATVVLWQFGELPVIDVVLAAVVPMLPGAAIGAALGVWLARGMGWSPIWVTGAVVGVVLEATVWFLWYQVFGVMF